MTPTVRRWLPTAATIVILAAVWEGLARGLGVPAYLFPSPVAVAHRWLSDPGLFLGQSFISLAEALAGLVLGGTLALLVGAVMARVRWLEDALIPLAVFVKMTPVVIVAPILALWFGFGYVPLVLIAAMLTFFPILVATVSGFRSPPPAAHDVLLMLDASPLEEARLLRFPSALPHLFAALKVSATLALLGAVVAEWVAGKQGIGHVVLIANDNLDTTTAIAGVVTLSLVGAGLVSAAGALERRVVFWQGGGSE